ncbi:lytic murein transglycosylase B [Comamonas endophytica]|uniref:Lytic murein transglycosylase B n=1 Tax=Comamonas endophytica TaxID=2949090 RepID=A0ABY6G8Y9_9BURK|nr:MULTISPECIES: lytic murein transglycosylase B [unclassified Acidovorax]MCD2511666.1 lytic murein transglycosylase B [Acidovorax sp. D4N7]UYG51047.1 lytic murein transglycosylase B [Acidovorax sp. 5MLIR]
MKRLLSTALVCLAACTALVPSVHAQATKARSAVQGTAPYAGRSEAMQMAADIAQRRGLPLDWVQATLGQARFLPQVPRLMTPSTQVSAKDWNRYRGRFIDPVRIRAGVRFWQTHVAALERAEREYGVPAEIIVGIIGVETVYGQQMGNFRVVDALATLSFDFPDAHPRAAARTEYFRGELEQFLDFTYRGGMDLFALRGSYAGAMGLGQFMPSSWARWAVDFDGDGRIDLFRSPVDAIGSVANYFIGHGWKPGMATHYPVSLNATPAQMAELLAPDILPTFTPERMLALGARVHGGGMAHPGPLALVELRNGVEAPLYIAGTENFYAVTRYNWSSYYALSVIELGEEVRMAREMGR